MIKSTLYQTTEKAKPVAKQGRKAKGLMQTAGCLKRYMICALRNKFFSFFSPKDATIDND